MLIIVCLILKVCRELLNNREYTFDLGDISIYLLPIIIEVEFIDKPLLEFFSK